MTSNGSETDYYPSAFSIIQIPYRRDESRCLIWACSIDARWAQGNNVATSIAEPVEENFIQRGVITSTVPTAGGTARFVPVNDGTWFKISMDLDWLYALTPIMRNAINQTATQPPWTSLASLLTTAGFDNSTGLVNEWRDLRSLIEGPHALIIVEGLACIGLAENGGRTTQFGQAGNSITEAEHSNTKILQDRKAVLPPHGLEDFEMTQLHWSVTIAGYTYLAEGFVYSRL